MTLTVLPPHEVDRHMRELLLGWPPTSTECETRLLIPVDQWVTWPTDDPDPEEDR